MLPTQGQRSIVWIASHAKSGNTWVRFILANLLRGPITSAAAVERLIPDVRHALRNSITPPRRLVMMKTHFHFSPEMPLADHTLAFVYIVRNPLDVVVSAFYHFVRYRPELLQGNIEASKQQFVEDFLEGEVKSRWPMVGEGFGDWPSHVRSWLKATESFPHLILRYEDILKEPLAAANQLHDFLRLSKGPAEILRAVENSSFERMRQIEEVDIREKRLSTFYYPQIQGGIEHGLRFVREGKAGAGAAALTEQQRHRLLDAFGPMMKQTGYVVPDPREPNGVERSSNGG